MHAKRSRVYKESQSRDEIGYPQNLDHGSRLSLVAKVTGPSNAYPARAGTVNELAIAKNAKLPEVYNAAKATLAKCASLDECKQWKDKAAAMASYARQANDKSLQTMADRIRARAITRCGELLEQIEKAKNQHDAKQKCKGGSAPSRTQAAKNAGLKPDQAKQALRLASIPKDMFEEAIERDKPATLTELEKMGTKKKPRMIVDLHGRNPKDFNIALHAMARLQDVIKHSSTWDFAAIARGMFDDEYKTNLELIEAVRKTLSKLEYAIEKEMSRESITTQK